MFKLFVIVCFASYSNLGFAQDPIPIPSKGSENDLTIINLDEAPIYPGCKRKKLKRNAKSVCLIKFLDLFLKNTMLIFLKT